MGEAREGVPVEHADQQEVAASLTGWFSSRYEIETKNLYRGVEWTTESLFLVGKTDVRGEKPRIHFRRHPFDGTLMARRGQLEPRQIVAGLNTGTVVVPPLTNEAKLESSASSSLPRFFCAAFFCSSGTDTWQTSVITSRLCYVGGPAGRKFSLSVVDPLAVEVVQSAELVAEALPSAVHLSACTMPYVHSRETTRHREEKQVNNAAGLCIDFLRPRCDPSLPCPHLSTTSFSESEVPMVIDATR